MKNKPARKIWQSEYFLSLSCLLSVFKWSESRFRMNKSSSVIIFPGTSLTICLLFIPNKASYCTNLTIFTKPSPSKMGHVSIHIHSHILRHIKHLNACLLQLPWACTHVWGKRREQRVSPLRLGWRNAGRWMYTLLNMASSYALSFSGTYYSQIFNE